MDRYYVEAKPEGVRTLYRIRRIRDKKPVSEANRYLRHKVRENCSPNTVRRYAFSLSYYLGYLDEQQMTVSDVFRLPFDRQQIHFTEFLSWVKEGKHAGSGKRNLQRLPAGRIRLVSVSGRTGRTASGFESTFQPCGGLYQLHRFAVPGSEAGV